MNQIKNLALVDDDDVFVFLTRRMIEESKMVQDIKVFHNGLEVLNFLRNNEKNFEILPEVMFLDLSMPIMDGWEFLSEFVKVNPVIGKKITIYVCSSSISNHDIERSKSIPEVTDFIIKPMTKDKITEIIKSIVN